MAAPPLQNTFEGGTNGVAITPGNSGGASGNPWDNVNGAAWVYDTARAKDSSVSMKAVNPAGQYVEWTGLGSLTTTLYIRLYVYLAAIPTAHWNAAFTVTTTFGNSAWPLFFGLDGYFYQYDGVANTPGPIGLYNVGQWIRVEASILPHPTAGIIESRLYNNPDSPVGSWSSRGIMNPANTGSDIDRVRIGDAGNPPGTMTAWIDNAAISTTGFIGPGAGSEVKVVVPSVPFW